MSTTTTLDSKLANLNKLLATTPVQDLINSARYVENLEGTSETRYNPVSFGGREWLVGPSGDSLVALSADQSGLSSKEKRYDTLDANGNITQVISKDRSMGERFLKDLPKIAAGTAFVLGAPALLNSASSLFGGVEAAAAGTSSGSGLLGLDTLMGATGTDAIGAAGATGGTTAGAGMLSGADLAIAMGEGLVPVGETVAAGGFAATPAMQAAAMSSPAALNALGSGIGLADTGSTLAKAGASLLGSALSGASNIGMARYNADKLREQGLLSQEQYNQLSQELENKYTAAGQAAQQGLLGVGERAAGMVGNFTPYGVTNQLFGTRFNPTTGTVETTLSGQGSQLYDPFSRVAAQSAKAAEMTNVDQLSTDYYNKLAALSAPETERQRLATEERLRAQGRLGVTGSAFGGTSPELLAQEQAIARQQLERELQSRQAALAERGTLIGQGVSAYSPISNLLTQQGQQQQLSGQLGQMSQAGRIAAGQLFAQPATQAYVQPLQFYGQGLQQVGQTERLGIASNLAAQQAALSGTAAATQNAFGNLLTPANITAGINAAGKLFGIPGLG